MMTISRSKDIDDVRQFWENNPLFSGESNFQVGSKEYFEEHRRVTINDCLAGRFDPRCFPPERNRDTVLDLGCGPGFWITEFLLNNAVENAYAADLTSVAIELTKKRLDVYGLKAVVQQENAEGMSFPDAMFSHVNCQGVIHHTPNTEKAVEEIARVLKPGGTASLSVYYSNILLRFWPVISWLGRLVSKAGGGMKGRGRESIMAKVDVEEIVRMYDGSENPIGKLYTRQQFLQMLYHYFAVDEVYFHFFPARALPFPIPRFIHRWLDGAVPFLIYVNLTKK